MSQNLNLPAGWTSAPKGEVAALLNSLDLSRRAVQSLLTASEHMVGQAAESASRIDSSAISGTKRIDLAAQRTVDQLQLALIERAEEFDRSIERVMEDLQLQVSSQSTTLVGDNRQVLSEIQDRIVMILLEAQEGISQVTREAHSQFIDHSNQFELHLDTQSTKAQDRLSQMTTEAVHHVESVMHQSDQVVKDAALRISQTAERVTDGSRDAVDRIVGESSSVGSRIEQATAGAVRELRVASKSYADHLDHTAAIIAQHLTETQEAANVVAEQIAGTIGSTVNTATDTLQAAAQRLDGATQEHVAGLVDVVNESIATFVQLRSHQTELVDTVSSRLDTVLQEVLKRLAEHYGMAQELMASTTVEGRKALQHAVQEATETFAESANVNAASVSDSMAETVSDLVKRVALELEDLPYQWRKVALGVNRTLTDHTDSQVDRIRTEIDAAVVGISTSSTQTNKTLLETQTRFTDDLEAVTAELIVALQDSTNRHDSVTLRMEETMSQTLTQAGGVFTEQVEDSTNRLLSLVESTSERVSETATTQIERVSKIARELRDTSERADETVIRAIERIAGQSVLIDNALEAATQRIEDTTLTATTKINVHLDSVTDDLSERLRNEVQNVSKVLQSGATGVADRMVAQSRAIEERIADRNAELVASIDQRDHVVAVWTDRFQTAVENLEQTRKSLDNGNEALAVVSGSFSTSVESAIGSLRTELSAIQDQAIIDLEDVSAHTADLISQAADDIETRMETGLARITAPLTNHLQQINDQQRRLVILMDRMEYAMSRREEMVRRSEANAQQLIDLVHQTNEMLELALTQAESRTDHGVELASQANEALLNSGQSAAQMVAELEHVTARLAKVAQSANQVRIGLGQAIVRAEHILEEPTVEPYRGFPETEDVPRGRTPERGFDRLVERAAERGVDRGFDRAGDRGAERGVDRGLDRGVDRAAEREPRATRRVARPAPTGRAAIPGVPERTPMERPTRTGRTAGRPPGMERRPRIPWNPPQP